MILFPLFHLHPFLVIFIRPTPFWLQVSLGLVSTTGGLSIWHWSMNQHFSSSLCHPVFSAWTAAASVLNITGHYHSGPNHGDVEGICSISPWRITVKSHYTSCTSWGKILSFLNAFLSPRLISASQSLLLLLLWRDTLLLTFYSISILSGLQFEQCHGNDLMQHKHLSSNDGSQGRHLLSAK